MPISPVRLALAPAPAQVCGYPEAKVVLSYTLGQATGFQFDLCSVIDCGSRPADWTGLDIYLCMDYTVSRQCASYGVAWNRGAPRGT